MVDFWFLAKFASSTVIATHRWDGNTERHCSMVANSWALSPRADLHRGYSPRNTAFEVSRVCVKDLRPHALVANACSILYGYVCREAFERGYSRVISYTMRYESGASLRVAGFYLVATSHGGSWNRSGRPRRDRRPSGPKVRWERWKSTPLPFQFRLSFASRQTLKLAA
jgi:hypothetical protein